LKTQTHQKNRNKLYYECQCGSDEHRLVFHYFPYEGNDEPTLYCSVFLSQYRSFFKRVWIALKYIAGYKCKYGHFDSTLLRPEDINSFRNMLNRFDRDNKDYYKNQYDHKQITSF